MRSCPNNRLTSVDFPTFGRPMTATRIRSPGASATSISAVGQSVVISAISEATPSPCVAEMAWMCGIPIAANSDTAMSGS